MAKTCVACDQTIDRIDRCVLPHCIHCGSSQKPCPPKARDQYRVALWISLILIEGFLAAFLWKSLNGHMGHPLPPTIFLATIVTAFTWRGYHLRRRAFKELTERPRQDLRGVLHRRLRRHRAITLTAYAFCAVMATVSVLLISFAYRIIQDRSLEDRIATSPLMSFAHGFNHAIECMNNPAALTFFCLMIALGMLLVLIVQLRRLFPKPPDLSAFVLRPNPDPSPDAPPFVAESLDTDAEPSE